ATAFSIITWGSLGIRDLLHIAENDKPEVKRVEPARRPYSAGGYLFRKFARGAWLRRHCHFPKFSAKCQACDLPRNFTILIASPDGRVCLAIVLMRIEVLPVSLAVEPITNVIGQRAKHANRQRSP